MTKQNTVLGLVGICLAVILISIGGLVSDFISHLLGSLDGLLLFAVCLMMLGIFALMLLIMAKEQGWLGGKGSSAGPGTPAAPAPPAGEGK